MLRRICGINKKLLGDYKMVNNDWYYSLMFNEAIYSKSKQAFEDFFCDIMKASDDNFQKIKASGRKGDYSCDGFNNATGVYYLCYSPEDIKKKITQQNAIIKISKDLNGIISKWTNIKNIKYVINDKFFGVSPEIHKLIFDLKNLLNVNIELFSMETLRNVCLSLNETEKQRILGYCPDLENSKISIDFDTISKIVQYLEKNPLLGEDDDNLVVPDFTKKIEFNNLSDKIATQLNNAKLYISKVDEFFDKTPSYDKERLRNYIRQIYLKAQKEISNAENDYSDRIFIYILKNIAYDLSSKTVIDNAIVIIATFFESCDVFEEPVYEVKNEQIVS